MKTKTFATIDANEAVASVAYRFSETIAIYPITPSSPMAESCDEWSGKNKPNLWGDVPQLVEMQSEAGVAGAVHGMLQAGSMSTTFTASQGLLLMIPNMYKIAGELLPFCMHVTARTLAAHALSIFGDHSDVMACRQTGFAMLASNSVQEAQDLACIAHAATLQTRIPFLHFFDGFRTSHEVQKIETLDDAVLHGMVDESAIAAFRERALTPDNPSLRGSAQNPDVFFQAREAANRFYSAVPDAVQALMDRFADLVGRKYSLVEYVGHPQADRVVVVMGSGAETLEETASRLLESGEKVGVLKIRLYRPLPGQALVAAIPTTCRSICVLDRTKEPGALGDPLYQDVITALVEARAEGRSDFECDPIVVGGRYGLSSKEFTPAMAKAVFDNLKAEVPKNHFTVGIIDDVTHTSLSVDESFDIEPDDVKRAVFFGLGADGTVGANKNSIKIIGDETGYAQGYFVYDSKKSGAITISHLRFGPRPIRAPYLISRADFVACHQWQFLAKQHVLDCAAPGAVFLVNSPYPTDKVWERLPEEVQQTIIEKKLKFYAIDAYSVARAAKMGGRINTIMQTCFFAISGVLPREAAIAKIKNAIKKSYAKKGDDVVQKNFAAVDATLAALAEIPVPAEATGTTHMLPPVSDEAPDFVKRVTGMILEGRGDLLPVSAFPVDGTWPVATAKWEKRNIAIDIPVWDSALCIQCNKCVMVCPHAAIRAKFADASVFEDAPATFKTAPFRSQEVKGAKYTIQIAPEDCTGCTLCVNVCPAKDRANPQHKALNMAPQEPLLAAEKENFRFFQGIPNPDRSKLDVKTVKASQFLEPLFEFSGACAGCGETPYIKLLTQLYGDRLLIANATGCSSIYGGNLPTTPYTTDGCGRGPAWANSLFEDNAEFGLGIRLSVDQRSAQAKRLLQSMAPHVGDRLVSEILNADQSNEIGIQTQRERVAALRAALANFSLPGAAELQAAADYLVKKSVWIVGGDGWAYDIGYGGVDHVLASGYNVNILVMNTQVYSNTGGQQSKATPLGAVAKFASSGKRIGRKRLGLMAMDYRNSYVATVAFGAKDSQALTAILEAESYAGPSLVIAYSHCIAHGYNLDHGLEQQKLAVDSGFWPLYRFDPRKASPMTVDATPKIPVADFLRNETRFRAASDEATISAIQESCDEQIRHLRNIAENPEAAVV